MGAGHSWAPLVLTNDILVNLDNLDTVIANTTTGKVRAQAGIRLKDLIPVLRQQSNLGLANTGSITEQSLLE